MKPPCQSNNSAHNDRPKEEENPVDEKPLPLSEGISNLQSKINKLTFNSLPLPLFPTLVLTNIRGHFSERGRSFEADSKNGITGRLVQVRQAGSKPLTQSGIRAGVPAVASPGQIRHRRTSRGVCHGTTPAEKQQPDRRG